MIASRLGLVALLLLGCSSPAEAPPEIPVGTQPGQRAPALHGQTASGDQFSLARAPGALTVVVFYRSAHCGLCRLQLEQLQQYLPAYRSQGANVLTVTLDSPELSTALAEQAQLELDMISAGPDVFADWGVMHPDRSVAMPATYLVDRSGVIRFRHVGRNAADRTTDPELLSLIESFTGN